MFCWATIPTTIRTYVVGAEPQLIFVLYRFVGQNLEENRACLRSEHPHV